MWISFLDLGLQKRSVLVALVATNHTNYLELTWRKGGSTYGSVTIPRTARYSPISHKPHISSLSLYYYYFHGGCSEQIYSLVPPIQIFTTMNNHVQRGETSTFTSSSIVQKEILPKTPYFSRFLRVCFPDHNNLILFKPRANH